MIYFTKNDEYARVQGSRAQLGLSKAGIENLGDVTFVELPEVGTVVEKDQPLCGLEAVKAAIDYYSPLSGKVVEVNLELKDKPQLMNKDPEGQGWIVVLEMSKPEEIHDLMNEELYGAYLEDDED